MDKATHAVTNLMVMADTCNADSEAVTILASALNTLVFTAGSSLVADVISDADDDARHALCRLASSFM